MGKFLSNLGRLLTKARREADASSSPTQDTLTTQAFSLMDGQVMLLGPWRGGRHQGRLPGEGDVSSLVSRKNQRRESLGEGGSA